MSKNTKNNKLKLSPSELHNRLVKDNVPQLAYDGSDKLKWKRTLKRKVISLLGERPKDKCELAPKTLWSREHELGTIEKVAFTSEPSSDVVAFVCLPKDVKPPYTYMICVQGHSTGMHKSIAVDRDDNTLPIENQGDRDFALGCMARGLAAVCIEQRSFGERRELKQAYHADWCQDAAMHALMLGRTLLGERVYDVDRAIDYIISRGDGDPKRIGVMGNSGGGTVSVFSAAVLDRIAFAMPSCYFCTFEASVMSIFHCVCNYVPSLLKYAEMSDIMGLFAPKPVVLVAGKEDPIFPIASTRKAFRDLKKIYSDFGAADKCKLVVGPEGHRFYADLAWPKMLKLLKDL